MRAIRAVLGFIILKLDRLTSPKPVVREPVRQTAIDAETSRYTLYHLEACPFCVKVRREIRRLDLKIAMKDVGKDSKAFDELMAGGKQDMVPCLRIDSSKGTQWMYESSDINEFLRNMFPA